MSYNKGKIKVQSTAKKLKNPYKDDVIWDPKGQWAHPGEITKIPSGDITMYGVPYPVLGIDNIGYTKMMYPGEHHSFPGSSVTEYPMMKYGGTPHRGQIYDRLGRLHSIKSYVPFAQTGGAPIPSYIPPPQYLMTNEDSSAYKTYFNRYLAGKADDRSNDLFKTPLRPDLLPRDLMNKLLLEKNAYLDAQNQTDMKKDGGSNTKNMSKNFKGRKYPFPQIQSAAEFFSPAYHNIDSPYDHGSFQFGGGSHPFNTQPTMAQISSYGRPNWPYFIAQFGGNSDVQDQNVYNSTMDAMGVQSGADYRFPTVPGAYGQYYGGYQKNVWPPMYSTPEQAPAPAYVNEQNSQVSQKKKQKGGPATINQGPEYFTSKQNEFTGWLRNQAMTANMKEMTAGMMKNGGTGYPEMFPYAMPYEYKNGGNWIQEAVNPAHKGFCSPMSKKTCTPKRKAFAMTMKKHHGFHKQEGGEMQEEKWQAIIALTEQGITDPAEIAQELNTEGTYPTNPEEVAMYLQQYSQDQGSEEYQMGGEGGPDINPNAMDAINMYSGAYGQASQDADVNSGLMNFINASTSGYQSMYSQPMGGPQSQSEDSAAAPTPEYRKMGGPKAQKGMQYKPSMIPNKMPSYHSGFPGYYPDPGYYTNQVDQGSVYNYPMYGRTNMFPANFNNPNVRQKLKISGKKIYMNTPMIPGQNPTGPGVYYGDPNIEKIKEYSNIFGSGRKIKFRVPYYGELPEEPKKERKSLKDYFKGKKGTSNALPESNYQQVPGIMPTSLAPANKEQWMRENSFPYTAPQSLSPGAQAFMDTQPEWVNQNLAGYNPQFGSSEINPMTGAYMPPVNFGSDQVPVAPIAPQGNPYSALPPGKGPLKERLARLLGVNTASGKYMEKHGYKMGGRYQEGGASKDNTATQNRYKDPYVDQKLIKAKKQMQDPYTVFAVPDPEGFPGDSTRYFPGQARTLGIPYMRDLGNLFGISDINPAEFQGAIAHNPTGRTYSDSSYMYANPQYMNKRKEYQVGGPYDYLRPDSQFGDPENLPGYMPPPTLTNQEMVRAIGDEPNDQINTPSGYITGKYKEHYADGMNQEDQANWGIAGLGLLGNLASLDEQKDAEEQLRRKFKAENIFTSRQDRDRGDYTTNQGYFRPDQTVPVQFQGSKAGSYQAGGEYELSDEEIQNILKNGGTIEYI